MSAIGYSRQSASLFNGGQGEHDIAGPTGLERIPPERQSFPMCYGNKMSHAYFASPGSESKSMKLNNLLISYPGRSKKDVKNANCSR